MFCVIHIIHIMASAFQIQADSSIKTRLQQLRIPTSMMDSDALAFPAPVLEALETSNPAEQNRPENRKTNRYEMKGLKKLLKVIRGI